VKYEQQNVTKSKNEKGDPKIATGCVYMLGTWGPVSLFSGIIVPGR
tara:strand:+ start:401 stop:538 length:138 start_codon:yes stop_codon:yes gene_type:complete